MSFGLGRFNDDRGQETFEYLLVAGLVIAAMIAAMLGLNEAVQIVAGHSCPAVDTAKGVAATVGSCIG